VELCTWLVDNNVTVSRQVSETYNVTKAVAHEEVRLQWVQTQSVQVNTGNGPWQGQGKSGT
jgi:hypothetical protein